MQSNPEGPREPDDTPGDPSEARLAGDRRELRRPGRDRRPAGRERRAGARRRRRTRRSAAASATSSAASRTTTTCSRAEEERFEPPPPPPLPRPAADRLAAWVGVFGAPAVLLTALILGISLPTVIGYLLVAAFVGGFVYLVYRMPRGPRDPWDDGAQV